MSLEIRSPLYFGAPGEWNQWRWLNHYPRAEARVALHPNGKGLLGCVVDRAKSILSKLESDNPSGQLNLL